MGKLIYNITTSLDGYAADRDGDIGWGAPSEEVLECVNDLLRDVRTFLLGRKVYETLAVWDTIPIDGASEGVNEFGKIWRAARKIVYSRSLSEVETANTTLERTFNAQIVKKLVAESDGDFDIGGPHLAAEAIRAGIVDEYSQFVVPLLLGGGNYWLPKDATGKLELVEAREFKNGFAHLRFRKV